MSSIALNQQPIEIRERKEVGVTRMVGLDHGNKTIFELAAASLGSALCVVLPTSDCKLYYVHVNLKVRMNFFGWEF